MALVLSFCPVMWCQQTPVAVDQDNKPLTQLSLEQLGTIKVTSVSKEPEEVWRTPAAIYVITSEDIRRSGARTLADILRLAPGVDVAQIDSVKFAVGIRGFMGKLSRSVLVLIDGRSVYTPLFAGVYWEMQDTLIEDIDRIEVIRGSGGTVWGSNAVNGVINIITKHAKDTRGTLISAGGGNVQQGFVNFRYGAGDDEMSYRFYGKAFTRGPQYHSDDRNFDDSREGEIGFRSDWEAGRRDSVSFQGDAYRTIAGSRLNVSTFNPPALLDVENNAYFTGGNLIARWSRRFKNGSDMDLHAYYDRTDREDLNFREIRNTFDVDFIHHLPLKHQNVIWGLGLLRSPSHFIQVVPTVDFQPHHQTYNIFSGFLQDEVEVVPNRLFVQLGTKLEHNSFSGFEVQPSGRVLWTPARRQALWAAVTRAVRTPSRVEDNFAFSFLALPNPPLFLRLIGDGNFQPERMLGYEAGYRNSWGDEFYWDISAFYNFYDNLESVENFPIEPETTPSPPHLVLPIFLRNGLEGETSGMELSPSWQATSWWRLDGSYSFLHLNTRRKPFSDDASSVKQTEGDSPHHKVVVRSAFDLPRRLSLDLTYRYVSAVPNQKVDAYSTGDARLAWRIHENLEFSIAGRNLLQPFHFEYGGDTGPLVGIKRSVYGEIRFTSPNR